MAGKTSKVSRQLTIARTSQKGTMMAVDGKNAADHGAEVAFVQRGDDRERMDGSADGAPRYRRGVGDEVEGGGGLLHDFELAGLDRCVIEEYGGDDNPDDFEETERGAI